MIYKNQPRLESRFPSSLAECSLSVDFSATSIIFQCTRGMKIFLTIIVHFQISDDFSSSVLHLVTRKGHFQTRTHAKQAV